MSEEIVDESVELTTDDNLELETVELTGNVSVEDFGSWEGILALVGVTTSDGRRLEPGGITHRELPLTLMGMFENAPEGHDGAVAIGSIDEIWSDGDQIMGKGKFASTPEGQKARTLRKEGVIKGISVDLEPLKVERFDDYINVLEGRIMGATFCPFPAFADAQMTIVSSGMSFYTSFEDSSEESVVEFSSNIPVEPPAEWFHKISFKRAKPVQVDATGRVYGHIAQWDSCHIGFKDCKTVPKCKTYGWFMNKTVLCDDGSVVACGNIFMNTVHADTKSPANVAADHYAHTGSAVADVAVYEDEFGVYVAGALRPSATPEQVRAFRGSSQSGDWRKIKGKWQLVGILAVNVPGFGAEAILASGVMETVDSPRAFAEEVDGEFQTVSLVAAGLVAPSEEDDIDNETVVVDYSVELAELRAAVNSLVEEKNRRELSERQSQLDELSKSFI